MCELGTDFVKMVERQLQEGSDHDRRARRHARQPLSAAWQKCAEQEIAKHKKLKLLGKADTNWTQEGSFKAMSGFLAQYGSVDAVVVSNTPTASAAGCAPTQAAKRSAGPDRRAAHRRAGRVLRLGEGQRSQFQDLLLERPERPVALRADGGDDEEGGQGRAGQASTCRSRCSRSSKGMCNPAIPEDASLSTLVDDDMMKAMFAKQ